MASIPSLELTLLQVHQSLGLERPQSKPIKQFTELGMQSDRHREISEQLVDGIALALDLDKRLLHDIGANLASMAAFYKGLTLQTWTGNASQQQILWHLFAYFYVPTLTRAAAFVALSGFERDDPVDAGMPGGVFWFLPSLKLQANRVDLPLSQVIDWLLDLLGNQSLENATKGLERVIDGKSINANALRRLQGWRLEGRLPKSAQDIAELFHDDATLVFLGAFSDKKDASSAARLASVLQFVQRKGLDSQTLADQIPMGPARLEAVLGGCASEEENQVFVELVASRYAAPTMRTIRRRLLVARLVQDGYQRLLDFLFPGVHPTCADPAQNKLLQLIGLFHTVYNLTIDVWKNGGSHCEQDARFEAKLAPWDQADLLLSILPSMPVDKRCSLLAERLTRKFMRLEPEAVLEDIVPSDGGNLASVIQRRVQYLEQEFEENRRYIQLLERIRIASPWRALQAENSYWVVSQIAQQEALPDAIRGKVFQRLRELATTPSEVAGAVVLELGYLLSCPASARPHDIQHRVQCLLEETPEASAGFEEWKAPVLRLRAKHSLMQNRFEKASEDYTAALDATLERGYGSLAGEIAREGLATHLAVHGFAPKVQERYYRNMVVYGMFEEKVATFEDTAPWCEEYFWADLYSPYPGFEHVRGMSTRELEAAFAETLCLIETANWDALSRYAKVF